MRGSCASYAKSGTEKKESAISFRSRSLEVWCCGEVNYLPRLLPRPEDDFPRPRLLLFFWPPRDRPESPRLTSPPRFFPLPRSGASSAGGPSSGGPSPSPQSGPSGIFSAQVTASASTSLPRKSGKLVGGSILSLTSVLKAGRALRPLFSKQL